MINVNVAIEVNFVGDRKMRSLNRIYRGIDRTTDVLSFPLEDIGNHEKRPAGYINPPDDILRLGSIVVSYPQAVMGAAQENCLVDQKIAFLVEHGMMHLLGYHHQENE
jgi:probable rRNA maturation factor